MSAGGCAACSASKREWVWQKLGGCLRCMRLSWWGMIATWLALAGAVALAMPLTVTISVGVAALALSPLWLIHWGAFVGKHVAMVSEIMEVAGEALSRREMLKLAWQQACAAIVLACWADFAAEAQDKPGCGDVTVPITGQGSGATQAEACAKAKENWHAALWQEVLQAGGRCAENESHCQGGECVFVGWSIPAPVQCNPQPPRCLPINGAALVRGTL